MIASYAREAEDAGAVVTIVSSDKDLMQLVGDRIDDARPDEEPPDRRRRGAREVRRRPRQGRSTCRRCAATGRQCAGRAGDRGQDRGAADQHLWRPRNAARPRRRDQAAETARKPDRPCRQGAAVASAGRRSTPRRRCPARSADLQGQAARPATEFLALAPGDGVPHAGDAHVAAPRAGTARRRADRRQRPSPRCRRSRRSRSRTPTPSSTRSKGSTTGSRRRPQAGTVAIWPADEHRCRAPPALAGIASR